MTNGLAVADYAIIAGFFAVMLGIGFYFSGRMKSMAQFFGGGKRAVERIAIALRFGPCAGGAIAIEQGLHVGQG